MAPNIFWFPAPTIPKLIYERRMVKMYTFTYIPYTSCFDVEPPEFKMLEKSQILDFGSNPHFVHVVKQIQINVSDGQTSRTLGQAGICT